MMVNMFGEAGYKSVSEELFISLCPILIYQLDKKLCTSPQIGSTKGHVEGHHRDDQEPETKAGSGEVSEYNFANIPARGKSFRKKKKCL